VNPTTVPHVSVQAVGGGHPDFYVFTVTQVGSTATFDIDLTSSNYDSYIHLYDANGNQLASADDSNTNTGAGGSTNSGDAFLTHTFAQAGTYYLAVKRYNGNEVPAGVTYTLQVSLQNALMALPGFPLAGVNEDAGTPSGAVGTLVSSLVDLPGGGGHDNVTDVDSGTQIGIALTGTDAQNGIWWYSLDGGASWAAVGTVSDSQALLLTGNARLYFQPAPDFYGTVDAAIRYRAWDMSAGTAGQKVNASANGGVTAFSSASATSSIVVQDSPEANLPPSINAPSTIQYWSTNTNAADLTYLNRLSFQDVDGNATVRAMFTAVGGTGDTWTASNLVAFGLVLVGNAAGVLTLDGTLADLNHWLAGNNLAWNPGGPGVTGPTDRTIRVDLDTNPNAQDGAEASANIQLDSASLGLGSNTTNAMTWNLNGTAVAVGGGSDTVVTSWSNGPSGSVSYDGGENFLTHDTVTIVFTATQLEAVLTGDPNRSALLGYFDGQVDGASLNLNGSAWNGSATGFEDALIGIAAGNAGYVQYAGLPQDRLPTYAAGLTGSNDTTNDLRVGTSANNVMHGGVGATEAANNGHDILAGLLGDDTLWGGAGNDLLLGGEGNDELHGGIGNDILAGGRGTDNFVFAHTGSANLDAIVDYSFVDGDMIDLSALLDGSAVTFANKGNYISLTQSGSDITVAVDVTGSGSSFASVAVLAGYATSGVDPIKLLIDSSQLNVAA
jgi:hypothetical protein